MTTEPTAEKAEFAQTQKATIFLVILAIAGIYFFVIQRNSPPVADDQSSGTTENASTTIGVRFDDPDFERDGYEERVRLLSVGQASNGTVQIVEASNDNGSYGQIRYTPNPNFYGRDSFTYTVADKRGEKAEGTYSISVRKSEARIAREEREAEERAEAERQRLEAEAVAQAIGKYFNMTNSSGRNKNFIDLVSERSEVNLSPVKVLVEEDFNSSSSAWGTWGSIGSDDSYAVIEDGELHIKTDKPNHLHYSILDLDHKNFAARFDMIIHNERNTDASGGLLFGMSDQGYYFWDMNYKSTAKSPGSWEINWYDRVNNKWGSDVKRIGGKEALSSNLRRITYLIAVMNNGIYVCRSPGIICNAGSHRWTGEYFTSKSGQQIAFVSNDQNSPVSFDNLVVLELRSNITIPPWRP